MLRGLVVTNQMSVSFPSIFQLSQRARTVACLRLTCCPGQSQSISCFHSPQRLGSDHLSLLGEADTLNNLKLSPNLTLPYKASKKDI